MASYSGSIDISLIENINDKNIVSMKTIYYASAETDPLEIPPPVTVAATSDEITQTLRVSDGVVIVSEGAIALLSQMSKWSYEKPEYVYGFHLWTSMEVITSDGTIIYSEPVISGEWESYYNIEVGGTNLIRNSKTLIDERIYFE